MSDDKPFRLEEATINELHEAIKAGRATCVAVVRRYIERVRAYNGVCSALVTEDGAPVPAATGAVRAKEKLRFPTETIKASTIFPMSTNTRGHRSNSAAWSRLRPTLRYISNTG